MLRLRRSGQVTTGKGRPVRFQVGLNEYDGIRSSPVGIDAEKDPARTTRAIDRERPPQGPVHVVRPGEVAASGRVTDVQDESAEEHEASPAGEQVGADTPSARP